MVGDSPAVALKSGLMAVRRIDGVHARGALNQVRGDLEADSQMPSEMLRDGFSVPDSSLVSFVSQPPLGLV